ncbi:MAG: hypothetical protein ACI9CA_001190 [Natronomonas sp.]|jgi:hypothetical protein
MSFERCPDPVWLSGGTLNHLADEPADMPKADAPDDLPDRIVSVLKAADTDGPVSAGRLQRLLARDGIDVASSVIRETCSALAEEGQLVEEPGPRYILAEG